MRYYEVHYPNGRVDCPGSVRHLRDLPGGTKVWYIITERDGTCVESKEIPVVGGRPQVKGRGVRRPKMWWG